MSDVTLLRTMTFKSTMKFGKYHDLTVRGIIDMIGSRGVRYLVWVYYSASKVSFMPDVLDELYILPENRIEKAGNVANDEELHYYQLQAKKARQEAFHALPEEDQKRLRGMARKKTNWRKKTNKQLRKLNANKANSKQLNKNREQARGSELKNMTNQNKW